MKTKKTKFILLLCLATLLITCVAVVPTAVGVLSAAPANSGEIMDFSYQTLTGADVKNDSETDLRFLFSVAADKIGDYTTVGFVFSKSDPAPEKTDDPNPNYTSTETVYRSVTANGNVIDAPDGRFWAAVKLSSIPHDGFATYVYVRPYVEDGAETRYGETERINVCEALGHVHEIQNPTGTATLLTPGTRCGDCAACGLYGIVERDVYAAVADEVVEDCYVSVSTEEIVRTSNYFQFWATLPGALEEGETFYPSDENGGEGRDLYYEIDVLWNETMVNMNNDVFKLSFLQLAKGSGYRGSNCSLFYFTPKDDSNCKNKYKGGFDWDTGLGVAEGPDGGNAMPFDCYPNLNDSSESNDWGWHRIGFRIHESARVENGNVIYSGYSYLYIDGVQRWKIELDMTVLQTMGMQLYVMDVNGNCSPNWYGENVQILFWVENLKMPDVACYTVTANMRVDAVKPSEFSTGVVPVENPAASKYVLMDGLAVDAKVYFRAE